MLKNLVVLLFLSSYLALTGCGAVQQAQLNSASQQAQTDMAEKCSLLLQVSEKEARAWEDILLL